MSSLSEFIGSGILELYALGAASDSEREQVEQMAATHPEVSRELDEITLALSAYVQAHAVEPLPSSKPLLMATINYIERIQTGEPFATPPLLTPESAEADYAEWLQREDMTLPAGAEDIYVRLIGVTPSVKTAILWVKNMTHYEVHHDEYERFLILEGTCNFILDKEVYPLKAGDFIEIPLHTQHRAEVTSAIPCKAILQRVAV